MDKWELWERSNSIGTMMAHAVCLNPALTLGKPIVTAEAIISMTEYFDIDPDTFDVIAARDRANEILHLTA